jgi:hypothetical protein
MSAKIDYTSIFFTQMSKRSTLKKCLDLVNLPLPEYPLLFLPSADNAVVAKGLRITFYPPPSDFIESGS